MKALQVLAAVAALMFGTVAAQATTYDLSHYNDPGSTMSSVFTLSCDVGGVLNGSCSPTISANGAGVNGRPDTDPSNIDSFPYGSYETLIITFVHPFLLNSFTLGNFGFGDDYEFATNLIGFGAPSVVNPQSVGSVVNWLAIRASAFNIADLFAPDSFTLKSINGVAAAVPVPAGAVLLGSGLAALGLFGWRRKRTATTA